MSGHSHLSVLGERLILATLTGDEHARGIIAGEIEDCAHCWRFIAEQLAESVALDLRSELGDDVAIALTEVCIARALDWQAELDGGQS